MNAQEERISMISEPDSKIHVQLELDPMPLTQAIQVFEEQYIRRVVVENEGHKGKAAAMLNIDRKTLYRKMRRYRMLEQWKI